MKKKKLFIALLLSASSIGYSQWTRVAPNTFLSFPGDYVGIGRSSPWSGGNKFEVEQGGVMFQSTQGGRVRFENPNLEEGFSIHTLSGTSRADIRLDTSSVKLGCNTGSGAVGTSNLLYITKHGKFGVGKKPIGTAAPKFEIDAGTGPWANGLGSGLRFTRLNSSSTTAASNGKVLTVNASGDVILTTDQGSAYTPGTGITFAGNVINSTWTQTGNNIVNNNSDNVGIGVAAPTAKLDVASTNLFSIRSNNSAVSNNINNSPIAVSGQADNNVGVGYGGSFMGGNTGVYGGAEQNLDNLLPNQLGSILYNLKGVEGYAYNYGVNNTRWATGVRGQGFADAPIGVAVGVEGYAFSSGTTIGIFGDHDPSLWGSPNAYAGYFNGDVFVNGFNSGVGYLTVSDNKLKKNVEQVENGIEIINKLKPATYTFKTEEYAFMNLPKEKQYGFIAQELEKVMPEAVMARTMLDNKKEKFDYKGVNYIMLIPVLTKAIQEQQVQIEAQQKQIDEFKTAISKTGNSTDIDNYSNDEKGYLSQNVPNPFTQKTVIDYRLPENTKTAAIGVYDMNGKEITLVTLNAEPAGSVTIDGGSMQAGMYLYSLIINGLSFETKRMVLTSH